MSALQQLGLRTRTAIPHLLALCALVGASGPQAKADAIADFYKGRTVTVVVSSSAGGGYDTLARALARYMGRHMPSHPVFVVRNMPGAGGMAATNFLYNNADKDGSVIGLVQNNTPFEPLFGIKEARYDPVKFNWLGSPSSETAMVLIWHAVPVNSVAELKAREVAVGVSGANSTPGVPVERLAALREAFAATMADPDFLAEGEKLGLGLNAPRAGAQIQEVMQRAYQSPPRVIDRLRQLNVP